MELQRKLVLALMMMGFSADEAMAMDEDAALSWLTAYADLRTPNRGGKKYLVRRKKDRG